MYGSSQKNLQQSLQQQLHNNESNNVNISRESQKMTSKKPRESCSRTKVNGLVNAPFYTPSKQQNSKGLLVFSGGIRDQQLY